MTTTYEMITEASKELKAINEELDQVFSQKLARNPSCCVELELSQRAWLLYRDREDDCRRCGVKGGSIEPLIGILARIELTRERIEYLKRTMIEGCF